MKNNKSVAIVLAGYNESKNVDVAMQELYSALEKNFEKYELILIDDASLDDTYEKMLAFSQLHQNVKAVTNGINLNFGISILRGMFMTEMDYITFSACDLPVKTEELIQLIIDMPEDLDVLIMERMNYKTTKWRTITSGVNSMLLKILFPFLVKGTPVLNFTQIYTRVALQQIVPLARSPIFVWPELIFRTKIKKLNWVNVPVECSISEVRRGSFGHPHDIMWGIYEMLRFRIKLWFNQI